MNTPINIDELKASGQYTYIQKTDISPAGLDLWAEQAHKRVMQSVDDYCVEQSLRINQSINWPDTTSLYPLHVSYNIGQWVYFKYPHSIYAPEHTAIMKVVKKVGLYSYRLKCVHKSIYRNSVLADFYEMQPY
jgi:hypothetical protein